MDENQIQQNILAYFNNDDPSCTNIEIANLSLQKFEKTNVLSDIYFFDRKCNISGKEVQNKLVLKLGLGTDKSTDAVWKSEREVMSTLYESGYPVPKILGFGESLVENRGAFIVMERIEGRMLSDVINENIDDLQKVDELIEKYVNLMVELHNLGRGKNIMAIGRKNEMFTTGNDNPMVTYLNDYLKFTKHIEYHTLSFLLDWLIDQAQNLETTLELGITHGDFQTDNVIVLDNNNLCVIDWGFGRTADVRMDVHWAHLLNGYVHSRKVGDYIHNKYLKCQSRILKDDTFFEIASIARLLLGLSQLAVRSKNFHSSVNKFLKNLEFDYVESRLNEVTGLNIEHLENDFRKVTGVS